MSVVTKLANGIRVATLNNGVKAAQVGLWTGGSGQEDVNEVGTMNMLSNCVNLTSNPLVKAETNRNSTTVRSIGKTASTGLSRISEALNKAVTPETVEAAKDVAHGQSLALDDCWEKMANNYAMNTAFMHTPLGADSMGSEGFINSISADEIQASLKNLNSGSGMVIAAVGDVDHDKFAAEVEKAFGHLWSSGGMKQPELFTGSVYDHRFDSTNFGMASVVHHVPPPGHKFGMEFEVGAQIIGSYDPKKSGNQHSAFNIRQRLGHKAGPGMPAGTPGMYDAGHSFMAEHFYCDYEVYGANAVMRWNLKTLGQATGLFDEASWRVAQFVGNMYRRTTDYKLQMGKNNLIMANAMAMQKDPLGHIGQSVQDYGHVRDAASMKAAVGKVTKTSLEHAWTIYLVDQEVAMAKVGCTEKMIAHGAIRSFTNPKGTYW